MKETTLININGKKGNTGELENMILVKLKKKLKHLKRKVKKTLREIAEQNRRVGQTGKIYFEPPRTKTKKPVPVKNIVVKYKGKEIPIQLIPRMGLKDRRTIIKNVRKAVVKQGKKTYTYDLNPIIQVMDYGTPSKALLVHNKKGKPQLWIQYKQGRKTIWLKIT